MKVIYSPEHLNHNPQSEVYDGALYPISEHPERAEQIMQGLHTAGHEIVAPVQIDLESITAVHTPRYVEYIRRQSAAIMASQIEQEWTDGDGGVHTRTRSQRHASNFIMDSYTPLVNGTYGAAVTSASVAASAADRLIADAETTYALCRPPGHHAERQRMGGYCFFNNVAIAAQKLSESGSVAVLDIDFHHGNGTQGIFYDRGDVLFVSLHANPDRQFPYLTGWSDEQGVGDGRLCNANFPIDDGINGHEYDGLLAEALDRVVDFKPDFLAVSVGYDTYKLDPIAGAKADFRIDVTDFATMGSAIRSLDIPTMLVQEGGYYVPDLGKLAATFVRGFENN